MYSCTSVSFDFVCCCPEDLFTYSQMFLQWLKIIKLTRNCVFLSALFLGVHGGERGELLFVTVNDHLTLALKSFTGRVERKREGEQKGSHSL